MSEHDSRADRFNAAYSSGDAPWDSGIVPPEVQALVSGEHRPPPGRALDVGCGSGMSSVFLAQQGWQVLGVDFAAEGLVLARQRAAAAGLSEDQVAFQQGNAADPQFLADHPSVTLFLDIGCLHSLTPSEQQQYAGHVKRLVAAGGVFQLYCWRVHDRDGEQRGLEPDAVADLFAPEFTILAQSLSTDAAAGHPSAWYTMRRG